MSDADEFPRAGSLPAERIRRWLISLGNLTVPIASDAEANTKLDALVPMLARRYPEWVFCRRTLDAVAERSKFFPVYAELVAVLDPWTREHRPPQAALPPPARPSPEPYVPPAFVRREVSRVAAALGRPKDVAPAHLDRATLNSQYAAHGLRGPKAS